MSGNATVEECDCGTLREAGPFTGWNDFDAFDAVLKAETSLVQVPVKAPYSNVGLLERWYQCSKCQCIWRLVEPDPPFAGLWEQVS
ncbi:hypothetical protein JCM19000A_33510 [Silvimonas sp. JCM 19000]